MPDHHPVNEQGTRCPRCNKQYDFWTQDGRLIGPFHPMGDCKAPPLRLVAEIACEVCGEEVSESRPGVGHVRTCSTKCREILDVREKAVRRANALRRAELRSIARAEAKQASAEWFAAYKKRKAQ